METHVLPTKRTFIDFSPWSHVADSMRESAISNKLAERTGHAVTVRIVSVNGSDTDVAMSLEVEALPPAQDAPWTMDTGIKTLSDKDLADLLCGVLEDLTSGALYEASINARAYGNSIGPGGYRPRPTRISVVFRQTAT
jgi:hypothetical protein